MRIWLTGLAAVLLCGSGGLADQPASGGGNVVLNEQSWWRCQLGYRTPLVRQDGELVPGVGMYRQYAALPTTAPDNWMDPDFDDSSWSRCRFRTGMNYAENTMVEHGFVEPNLFKMNPVASRQSLRGRFQVDDPPSAGKLTLSIAYRGGAVVYVNGRELVRGNLPKGPLNDATLAEDYPTDVFVNDAGMPLPIAAYQRETPANKDRLAKRIRKLENVEIPADVLRKGVNIVAIDVFRAPYYGTGLERENLNFHSVWATCGLTGVKLTASGAVPANNVRPKGVQVWNLDRNDRLAVEPGFVMAYGDPLEPIKPIKLVGARNGFFSGQVAVTSAEAIKGLTVEAGELKGPGTIPATAIKVRYAVCPTSPREPWADNLGTQPPAEIAADAPAKAAGVQVVVTVQVPRDAAAGQYTGQIKVSTASSAAVAVPVELSVADWTIPDPRQFRTFVAVYQSPTSVALHYNVPEWSEEHWKYLDKSFELLGQVGNKALHIMVADRTQFGNDAGMLYWIRKPDGSFDYDFTVFDRYVKLAKKHCGTFDFVVVHIWHAGGWSDRGAKQENTVTVLDPATRKFEHMQVPEFATPESKKFWTAALTAMKEHLAKEGLDKAMCLGILSDSTAPKAVFQMFDEIMPGIGWHRGCHGVNPSNRQYYVFPPATGKVVYHEHCYGMTLADVNKPLIPLWNLRTNPGTAYFRGEFDGESLLTCRTTAERALWTNKQGFGRIGLDFWNVLQNRPEGKDSIFTNNIYNRWSTSTCQQREPTTYRIASPGPDGAVPNLRFETLREGIQEAEAAIIVSEAIDTRADKIGAQSAAADRGLLQERLNLLHQIPWERTHGMDLTAHTGWQGLNARLFAAAAEATGKGK